MNFKFYNLRHYARLFFNFRKFLILLLGLMSFLIKLMAQNSVGPHNQSSALYYYFGAQKIHLQTSSTNIYVETSTASDVLQLQTNIQTGKRAKGARMAPLAMTTRYLLKLADPADFDSTLAWLKKQRGVVVARAAVNQQAGKDHLYEDAFYVKLKPGTTELMLKKELAGTGCSMVKAYDYDNQVFLIRVGAKGQFDGLKMANIFYETGLFEFAEPDFRPLALLHGPPPPNDYLYPIQWGLKNTGIAEQFNGTPGADIGIEDAWLVTMGKPGIRIAVIDEGVDRTHPDLVNNIDPLGFGLTAANATSGSNLDINRSHGTSCAGIIAAKANNSIGVAGVAPLCKIIPVNLTVNSGGSFGNISQLATCIDWAWNQGGADILSNSWGGGLASSLVHDAIKRATTLGRGGKGAVVMFSSGNDDAGISFPAIFPETIAVGAMDMCYQRKSINTCDAENFWGSNYGTGIDVSAPGVKIATTKNGGFYNPEFNGTSAACPFVAGVAALILSVNADYSQAQVREILERSARKVGNYTYSRVPGQPNGSWSNQLGYGMVNAHQAVLAAQGYDLACKVSISADGPTEFCAGGSVTLRIKDVIGAGLYYWLRNGQDMGLSYTLNATTSGLYQGIILRPGGCRDTSAPIEVRVGQAAGTLQARAGNDTIVCTSTILILGGSPSASGGTALQHPLRGMAQEGQTNQFIRFDPQYPAEYYKMVKAGFNPDANQFYSGAANTPNGLFMISHNDKFVKVDTATGQVFNIGVASITNSWTAMTYNPLTKKIYAIATSGSSNQLHEINYRTGAATLLGTISGANGFQLIWLAADANGDLYAMNLASTGSAQIFKINLNPLTATPLPSGTGFQTNYAQGADIDPITGKLLLFGSTRAIGSARDFPGLGLWEANKTTGTAKLIGSVAQPFNWLDALAFAGPEYKYSWSPATYLSNAKDANPIFTGAPPGNYTYTLTVTDLCGQTAQSSITISVKPVVTPNANGILFVNASATGNNTGNSWANAVKSLQSAIQNSCHDVKQIWVARGTYKPATANRDSAFTFRNNLAIYGGFAGAETILGQRNYRLNPTILSGDIGIAGNRSDNSYNVISNYNNNLNATAILDGFTITNGQANKAEYARARGAGMFNLNSSPLVRNCIFTGNEAAVYGGAIFNQGAAATPTFINCVMAGNAAQFGGGVYNESSKTNIINCTISANQVAGNGGGVYSYGLPLATVRNSIVWGNANNGVFTAGIDNSTPIEVTHSLAQGGYAGTGNLSTNPFFVSQAPIGLGQLGDLKLLFCSPARNAGNNAALPAGTNNDLAGLIRIAATTIDMGAYEIQTNAGNIIYLDATATGNNEGTGWTNAFTTLEAALNYLNLCNGGTGLTMQIATGTYPIPTGKTIQFDHLNAILQGGYPAGGGARNAVANPVIFKGNVQVLKSASIDGVKVEKPLP